MLVASAISASIALGGGGVGVVGFSYGTHSPRLLTAGIVAAAIGVGLGAFLLDRVMERVGTPRVGSVPKREKKIF